MFQVKSRRHGPMVFFAFLVHLRQQTGQFLPFPVVQQEISRSHRVHTTWFVHACTSSTSGAPRIRLVARPTCLCATTAGARGQDFRFDVLLTGDPFPSQPNFLPFHLRLDRKPPGFLTGFDPRGSTGPKDVGKDGCTIGRGRQVDTTSTNARAARHATIGCVWMA